jgi:hypothetical protein
MAQASKTTKEVITGVTLNLTQFEAACLRAFLGGMTGLGKANDALASVWSELYKLELGDDPLVVTHTPAYMYVKDKE